MSDLESAHAKLQTQHANLLARSKATEESLTSRLNAAVAQGQVDVEQLQAKMAEQRSDMQRATSVLQSDLQGEICTLQAQLQTTQSTLSSNQHTLEADRARLGGQLAQTQTDLRAARMEADQTLLELRREREDRMRAQYALSDKSKECETHIGRGRKLDERCAELIDQTQLARQGVAKAEQTSETWRHRYIHMVRSKLELRATLRKYQLLLKYGAVASFTHTCQLRKLLMGVYEKVVQLCAAAITQPGVPPGMVPGSSGATSRRLAAPEARTPEPADETPAFDSQRHSRRNSDEIDTLGELADSGSTRTAVARRHGGGGSIASSAVVGVGLVRPSFGRAGTLVGPSASTVNGFSPTAPSSASRSTSATPGNMAALPRYSAGLTDREWELHVSDLARRAEPFVVQAGMSNFHLLRLLEDKLAILAPVVGELRSEVLLARSTSEGMFQRTLQLARKNMHATTRYERERTRADALRNKLILVQREAKRLKRIEYMYTRLTEGSGSGSKGVGGSGPSGSGGSGAPVITMRDVMALDREMRAEDSYAAARQSTSRRRRVASAHSDGEVDLFDGISVGMGVSALAAARSAEEKEISAVLAGALEDDAFLDSTSSDSEEDALDDPTPLSPQTATHKHRRLAGGKHSASGGGGGGGGAAYSAPPTRARTSPVQSPSAAAWEASARKRASLLSSQGGSGVGVVTGSVTPSANGSRSPKRASATKLPPTVRPPSHGGRTTHAPSTTSTSAAATPPITNVPTQQWTAPSPPQSARTTAKRASGRAVYVGSGSMTTRDHLDEKHSEAHDDDEAPESGRGTASGLIMSSVVARRTRNPYAVSARHFDANLQRLRRSEKSATTSTAAGANSNAASILPPRPSSGPRAHPHNSSSTSSQPRTATAPASGPKLYALHQPAVHTVETTTD